MRVARPVVKKQIDFDPSQEARVNEMLAQGHGESFTDFVRKSVDFYLADLKKKEKKNIKDK